MRKIIFLLIVLVANDNGRRRIADEDMTLSAVGVCKETWWRHKAIIGETIRTHGERSDGACNGSGGGGG